MSRTTWMSFGAAAVLGLSAGAVVAVTGTEAKGESEVGSAASSPAPSPRSPRGAARELEEAFISVAEQVGPSVVTIRVEAEARTSRSMRRFFGIPGLPREWMDPDSEGEEGPGGFDPTEPRGGSGVIVSEDGYIVTNNHVVDDAREITVILSDDREMKATVRGTDPESDIAVIKIDGKGLPAARWADPDSIRVGAWAIALGAPFSLDKTVTIGHVSGLGRKIGIQRIAFQDFIQTDASINPGNSGGPLVNLDGEVMGINTAILGMGTGVGFAVPSRIARRVAQQLVAEGKVSRPYLGVKVTDVGPDMAEAQGLADRHGALIQQVVPDTPAAKADIQPGDVVVRVGEDRVSSAQDLVNAVARHDIGEKVQIELWREGKKKTVAMVTATRPGPEEATAAVQKSPTTDSLGLELQRVDPEINRSLDRDPKAGGVVVRGVAPYGPAQKAGMQAGDVILKVDGRTVASPEDVARAIRESSKPAVAMLIEREGGTAFIAVRKPEPGRD